MEIPERVNKCCSVCCGEQPAGVPLFASPPLIIPSHLSCCVYCNIMDVLVFRQSLCPLMAPKWQSQRLARSAPLMEGEHQQWPSSGTWIACTISGAHRWSQNCPHHQKEGAQVETVHFGDILNYTLEHSSE